MLAQGHTRPAYQRKVQQRYGVMQEQPKFSTNSGRVCKVPGIAFCQPLVGLSIDRHYSLLEEGLRNVVSMTVKLFAQRPSRSAAWSEKEEAAPEPTLDLPQKVNGQAEVLRELWAHAVHKLLAVQRREVWFGEFIT